ncbi:hypothetical protein [Bosea sp. PAMC 26642]|uniref:hypothetical protein n=1 Tax=Bosea sp. (strain PAMC 26642) TaxID=1792307 RepID=UPI00077054E3|nr:hypothetical protein [Bosea sp. PAMC 26642]AMJ59489.1 hypothetical protein AXW83_03470 [Bosea sp. PAMC 26642]
MSMELWVALPAGEVVTAAGIVTGARSLGFELDLPDAMEFDDLDGFLPSGLAGERAGAEIQIVDPLRDPDMAEAFGERAGSIARIVAFSWGGSFLEGAFAFVFAAALVAGHDGVCFDPEAGEIVSVERIVETAHGLLEAQRSTPVG